MIVNLFQTEVHFLNFKKMREILFRESSFISYRIWRIRFCIRIDDTKSIMRNSKKTRLKNNG
jgi:hypothetical protein